MKPSHYDKYNADSYRGNYSYTYRKRRSKIDWAGTGVGDAFKANLDYMVRMPAQRLFYQLAKRLQLYVAQAAGAPAANSYQAKIKPQLSPCYTSYPSALAVPAALGLTAFLEYQAYASDKLLQTMLKSYLESPAEQDGLFEVDEESYKSLVQLVTRTVQTRLVLEDLSRHPSLSCIEMYRLFSAAQQNLLFLTVPEIVNAVVLYGDVLPDWKQLPVHPMTADILKTTFAACQPFFREIRDSGPEHLLDLGMNWVRALSKSLARYLPLAEDAEDDEETDYANGGDQSAFKFRKEAQSVSPMQQLPPLNKPQPPQLFSQKELADQVRDIFNPQSTLGVPGEQTKNPQAQAMQKRISDFIEAATKAGGQGQAHEDMRYDLLEAQARQSVFAEGPIQGNPTEGHEVDLNFGDNNKQQGEIFDRPVELSDDFTALQQLLAEADPLATAMRRSLYPNVERVPMMERWRTSGSLDVSRLAMAEFSSAIFKRYRSIEKADRRGRPVLLLACDGSGSLNHLQMRMLKVLSTAWLSSTARTEIEVLAGLYHSGSIRSGLAGPLVQWMYHPHKTPAIGRKDAVRTLVSLPDCGTGAQSDALSIAFMMQEARKIARHRMIYFILITDCAWNQSFRGPKNGKQEVESVFEGLYKEMKGKLHTTLVALGVQGQTGFEERLDKVICIKHEDLQDYVAVAGQIGLYVASCIQERSKWINKSGRS